MVISKLYAFGQHDVPSAPFFGGGSKIEAKKSFTVNNLDGKPQHHLDSAMNYILRLIVKEKCVIPLEWWPLAARAAFNYEWTTGTLMQAPT